MLNCQYSILPDIPMITCCYLKLDIVPCIQHKQFKFTDIQYMVDSLGTSNTAFYPDMPNHQCNTNVVNYVTFTTDSCVSMASMSSPLTFALGQMLLCANTSQILDNNLFNVCEETVEQSECSICTKNQNASYYRYLPCYAIDI